MRLLYQPHHPFRLGRVSPQVRVPVHPVAIEWTGLTFDFDVPCDGHLTVSGERACPLYSCNSWPGCHRSDVCLYELFHSNHLDVSNAARHTPPTLRCPSRTLTRRKISPACHLFHPSVPSPTSSNQPTALCHLCPLAVWEYNNPQWPAVARHVARGAGLRFQKGRPPRPA